MSSWIKCKYPAAFACGLLNSQPMGFYAPAQIVRDAREHGVEVLGVDVNESDWDCTLEAPLPRVGGQELRSSEGVGKSSADGPTPQPPPASGRGSVLRLGLRQVEGLQREAAERVVANRPYRSVEELRTRGRVPVHAIERLAAADAFRSMKLDRRAALWDSRALKQAPDLPLFAYAEARDEGAESQPAQLPVMPLSEHVVTDYQTVRLSLKPHPMRFLREHYAGEVRDRRPAARHPRRQTAVDGGAGADPPAAGQRQGRVLHHAGGRDGHRQSGRLARRVRQAAQDRHGRG